MPIDLKWIRNNPDHVRSWQQQRGLSVENVEKVLESDAHCRTLLKDLDNQRAQLKKLQKAMRPSKTEPVDREAILKRRDDVKASIRKAEQDWKIASRQTLEALWSVASPVDEQIADRKDMLVPSSAVGQKIPNFVFSSNSGLDVSHAILSAARSWFGGFPIQKLPSTVSMDDESEWALTSDLAHAMCGCKPSGCEICAGSTKHPGWLGMLRRKFPPKSIFGAKQLPQYVGIWGQNEDAAACNTGDTFQVVAMSSGTLWDARTLQTELVDQLKDFYKTMLCTANGANGITTRAVPATQLEMHELSRMVILVNDTTIMGWVSNLGDAASRSLDINFLGGGSQNKKDHVYFIEASVLTLDSVANILNVNSSGHAVAIPKSLLSFLLCTETTQDERHPDWVSVPLKSLLKQDKQLFSQADLSQARKDSHSTSKFPMSIARPPSEGRVVQEALTCPFEFLFPQ